LAGENPAIVHSFLEEISSALRLLESYPEIGPVAFEHFGQKGAIRSWAIRRFDKWRVFYTHEGEEIIVVRLLHTSRDIEALLEE
jgi:plasmid stabilization system protein ParE